MYLFSNHFIKLKSPAFWRSWKNQKLGLQGVWILAGQQVVTVPWVTVLQGASLCFGENFSSIGTWVWLLSCQIYVSRRSCHRGTNKETRVWLFRFSFWELDFVCCLFRVLCSTADTVIPSLTPNCWNSLKHWWLSLSVEPYSGHYSFMANKVSPGQWCFWKHHLDTVLIQAPNE